MFIPAFMSTFVMNKIDDEGDNGGNSEGEAPELPDDLGVPFESSVEDTDTGGSQETNTDNQEPSVNPAWQKILDGLPQEFHKQVLPELEGWDKNFAEVQSKYAPYKPLLENNVSMEDIQSSIQLAKWISSDPQAVYAELGRRFGFGKEQGQEQVDPEDKDDDDLVDLSQQEQNPQLTQLEKTVQGLQQMLQQEQVQKQEQTMRENAQREIDSEFTQIETAIKGKLAPDVRKEVIRRAVAIGDETGKPYSLVEGYKDYSAFVNRVRNSRANATAPSVLPGNGGLPVTKKNLGQMDEDERVNHIAEMARMLSEGK